MSKCEQEEILEKLANKPLRELYAEVLKLRAAVRELEAEAEGSGWRSIPKKHRNLAGHQISK
jgi:hypothetical protein